MLKVEPSLGVYEGDAGTQVLPVKYELAKAWPEDVSFRVNSGKLVRDRDPWGVDYLPIDEFVTIPAGEISATVHVTVIGDTGKEGH